MGNAIVHARRLAEPLTARLLVVVLALLVGLGALLLSGGQAGPGSQELLGKPDWSHARAIGTSPINNGERDIVCPSSEECGP